MLLLVILIPSGTKPLPCATLTALSWHRTLMAPYSHGTALSWHHTLMALHSQAPHFHGTALHLGAVLALHALSWSCNLSLALPHSLAMLHTLYGTALPMTLHSLWHHTLLWHCTLSWAPHSLMVPHSLMASHSVLHRSLSWCHSLSRRCTLYWCCTLS